MATAGDSVPVPRWLFIIFLSSVAIPATGWVTYVAFHADAAAADAKAAAAKAQDGVDANTKKIDKLESVLVSNARVEAQVSGLSEKVDGIDKDTKQLIRMHMKGANNER